ncbi:hypothetical protein [Streptomyces sp. NPDC053720]|uniref:glucuronyl esterase domain-containing protein n=1 Tax=Streptomyces sp. NPDC053720 TaxID=3154855 RepID=UPI0034286643
MVVSNNSGRGGAAPARRTFGERITAVNTRFPHWFSVNHRRYNGAEAELPVGHHMLLALIAPRPLYAADATEDLWADPHGEFLAARHARRVHRFLGETGLRDSEPQTAPGPHAPEPRTEDVAQPGFPAPDTPLTGGRIGYHLRSGAHDITPYDWDRYLDFADRDLLAPRASGTTP